MKKLIDSMLDAIEARWRKATPGPIDVHRIDNHDGSISYQLQQAASAPQAKTDIDPIGARVLTQFDDVDNPDARYDAYACANAYLDVPALIALVRELAPEAEAWRKGQEVLRELRDHVIPCGHEIEDLIGGEGAVTKCGACLVAKQAERAGKGG